MKILIAPLNWGLGHASRCIPLIQQYIQQGHQVILAGDGDSLLLLRQHFPSLRVIPLPSLELQYTQNSQQRGFYLRALWPLMRFTLADHYYLRQALAIEHFDLIISDNRFGFFSRQAHCVYITHQLYPILPKRLHLLQPLARALHACIYKRYHEVWVPDYADSEQNLSGALSHGGRFDKKAKYIGPLSRLESSKGSMGSMGSKGSKVLAILSGLEPQRTIFEKEILQRYEHSSESLLLVRGKVSEPKTTIHKGNITIIPSISDAELVSAVAEAQKIIARSGYSTIMDLEAMGVLHKAEFHPTPGQSEQEYLCSYCSLITHTL
jgi:UDP:flavonoid glycosyltransferase YjiC (YdhE family)